MARTAIPPVLEAEVLAKAADGWTTRRIASWLGAEKGTKVSHVAVARLLSKTRGERAEVAKVVLREKLGTSLTKDVDRLEQWASNLNEIAESDFEAIKNGADFARMGKDGPIYVEGRETLVKVVEQLRKVTETKLAHSGAGSTPEKAALAPLQAKKLDAEIRLIEKQINADAPPVEPSVDEQVRRLEALRARYPELRTLPGNDEHEDA